MALPGWAAQPPELLAAPAADAVASAPAHARWIPPRITRPWQGVDWTLTYVAFLGFVFVVTTGRIPAGAPLMALGLVGLVFQREKLRMPAWLILFGMFVGWCALGLLLTKFPDVVLTNLIELAKRFLIALVAVNALRSRAHIRFFVVFYLGCYALYPIRGTLIDYFIVGSTLNGRAVWNYEYSNPNSLAAISLLVLALVTVVLAGRYDFGSKLAAAAGFVALPLIVLLTQSRAAFVALTVAVFVALLGQKQRARSFLIVGAIGAVALVSMPQGALDRVKSLRNATGTDERDLKQLNDDGSANQRWNIWLIGVNVIKTHIFAGAGIGAYPLAHSAESRNLRYKGGRGRRDPHSTYMGVMGETGLPGFLLFISTFAAVVTDSVRVRRRARTVLPRAADELRFLQIGLLAFAIAAIWGTFDQLTHIYFFLAVMWSASAATKRELTLISRGASPETA